MEYPNLREYIHHVYNVQLPAKFLEENAPPLLYLKLCRAVGNIPITIEGETAASLFQRGMLATRITGNADNKTAEWVFKLADAHEVIEMLIRKAGLATTKSFDDDTWSDSINS